MPRPVLGPERRTNPLVWCVAIVCALLTTVVIVAGVVSFVGYLVIKPKVPQVSVSSAQLDNIYFDETSLLTVQVTILIKAANDNAHASASFYSTAFALSFRGVKMAYLVADPFDVPANSSKDLNYVPQSSPIPLSPDNAEAVSLSLRQKVVTFELKGGTRTRWRVGLIGSVKFWLHLDCRLHLPVNGTKIFPKCSSRHQ